MEMTYGHNRILYYGIDQYCIGSLKGLPHDGKFAITIRELPGFPRSHMTRINDNA